MIRKNSVLFFIVLFFSTLSIFQYGCKKDGESSSSSSCSWQKCLGGSEYDTAKSIQQITDGGFIVAGYTDSNNGNVSGNHGDYDFWLVKLDVSGNL